MRQLPQGDAFAEKGNFPSTTEAVPLDRLSPAGERCRVSDRVGNGWLDAKRQDGRGTRTHQKPGSPQTARFLAIQLTYPDRAFFYRIVMRPAP